MTVEILYANVLCYHIYTAHEGTVVQAIKTLIAWAWSTPSHQELANYFAKSFTTMKGNVRTAACEFLSVPEFIGISSKEKLLDLLVKTYEKSYAQIVQVSSRIYLFLNPFK